MERFRFPFLGAVFAGCVTLAALSACENTIEPWGNRAETYSIYGYLSENRHRQFIRIKRLDERPWDKEARSIDATVRLDNLTEGTSEVLKDSVISFEDQGSRVLTHNFWTDTSVRPQTKYRLVVEHPDGNVTRATTVTPRSVRAEVQPDTLGCSTSYSVELPPIKQERRARAAIQLERDLGGDQNSDIRFPVSRRCPLDRPSCIEFVEPSEGSVFFRFQPQTLLENFPQSCGDLTGLVIWYTYLGPEWYGTLPQDSVTFDPTESVYVENGAGFFGSLWRDSLVIATAAD